MALARRATLLLARNTNAWLSISAPRTLKTSTTEHPQPVYNEEYKILDKVVDKRESDLPVTMQNPYVKEQKKCLLCEYNIDVNYKNVKLIYQFVSPYTGMLYGRHITGLCKMQHKKLENEHKKAQHLAMMATYLKEVEFLKDPKLCDPERPVMPHPYG